jgi:hypothetical protein
MAGTVAAARLAMMCLTELTIGDMVMDRGDVRRKRVNWRSKLYRKIYHGDVGLVARSATAQKCKSWYSI